MIDHTKWAEYLLDAEAKVEAVAPITDVEPDLTIEDAYLIQDKILERKLADGERLIGAKLGLTSRAKQESMGVHEPIYAWLTDRMLSPLEAPIALDELIHPRAEPEIVFVLERDLAGPGVSAQAVLDATAAVCCGIEVIDSRYADFRFTLPDVVADDASAARFVLGPRRVPPDFDLTLEGCLLEVDQHLVATAAGAAVLGHPAEAVARLANALGARGRKLEAGWIVLSGGLTDAQALAPGGSITVTFARLGSVNARAEAPSTLPSH
jgi:2-oxo-3-hexenedioate decarboxylase